MQVGIQRNSHENPLVPLPREEKNRPPSQTPSPCFINRSYSSSDKWYFISQNFKRLPTTIHPDYFIFRKSRFRHPSLSKVHLLYSPKNTTMSTPRLVGDSVNQRLC
ncbi:hypothetical protein AVEN_176844-1 [Araneus ventricosus]|uniref:Uncharacterized protein n=1 Tax=Araneus ventricosus TaxID=182803 RepID=A0A4Y2VBG2_ARAVE|nr:hypothetical protein AVEN_176844-1 [Araneus ventricosus]